MAMAAAAPSAAAAATLLGSIAGGVSVSASWSSQQRPVDSDGGAAIVALLSCPPLLNAAERRLPCELLLAPGATAASGTALELTASARAVEMRVQGSSDREPQYVGTLRAAAAAAAAVGQDVDDGASTMPAGPLRRFQITLPVGWRAARLTLLSLANKDLCSVEIRSSHSPESAAAAAPPAAAERAEVHEHASVAAALPPSQLDELRMLVQRAAQVNDGGGVGAPALPASLELLSQKLHASSSSSSNPAASAAQALAAAVAKGALMEHQRTQKQSSQQTAGAAAHTAAPTTTTAFVPSPEAQWIAAQVAACVRDSEARLAARFDALCARVAALEEARRQQLPQGGTS